MYLEKLRFIKIWVAECSTGEELYSLSILLEEIGLYDKATIFATDKNEQILKQAKQGIFSVKNMKVYALNYKGIESTESIKNDSIIINDSLKNRITFACHDLTINKSFGKMNLIFCRNKLIYFNKELQSKVVNLLSESTEKDGLICLGRKDTFEFSEKKDNFLSINKEENIFKRL